MNVECDPAALMDVMIPLGLWRTVLRQTIWVLSAFLLWSQHRASFHSFKSFLVLVYFLSPFSLELNGRLIVLLLPCIRPLTLFSIQQRSLPSIFVYP
jgi:hypothetical protein